MHNTPRAHRRPAVRLLASACCLAATTGALAQESSPYYIGVRQTFTHDSNLYRTSLDPVSETVSRTGLLRGLDQRISRQRLYADVLAEANRYRHEDRLDNDSYAVTAGLDWETIGTLTGSLRYSTRNALADFGTAGLGGTASDQTTDQFTARARYGLPSKMAFDLGYDYRKLKYKDTSLANRNYSQGTVNAGLLWGVGGQLTLGLGGRATRGSAPLYSPVPPYEDEWKRRDIDLTAEWAATGFSSISARLSRTRETHTLASNAALSETTGSLTWNYQAGGRLSLSAMIARDTGTETTFAGTAPEGTTALAVDRSRLSDSIGLDARYVLTGKTSLSGHARHRRGKLIDSGTDTTTGYGLAVHYTPTRSVTLSCSVGREDRSVSGSTGEYKATLTTCSGDLTLR